MSYAFRASYDAGDVQLLTLVAAAAVHKVLQHHAEDELAIKWVNDIYRNGRKIAGILCERVDDADGYYIIVGVGVNVTTCELPSDLSEIVGFLCDDDSCQPSSLAAELATALDDAFSTSTANIAELSDYIEYYKGHCYNLPDDVNRGII